MTTFISVKPAVVDYGQPGVRAPYKELAWISLHNLLCCFFGKVDKHMFYIILNVDFEIQ